MSSIITSVLKLTFGILWDKLRDHTAKRLQHGDVTDETCREIIIRELDEITSTLEGLSRKDLIASISFLREGICLLNVVFCKANDNAERFELQRQDGSQSTSQMTCFNASKQNLQESFEEAIKKLPQIINSLDLVLKNRLNSVRMSFADARREATRAFNNKALSTKDRVFACKLRVISRILENFEDPELAVETCMLYLEELHNLEAVQEIFKVHIAGGLKGRFNKRKRQEIMCSVIMINYTLANFTLSFAEAKYNLFAWPKVELNHRTLHPLLDPIVTAIMNSAKIGAPNIFEFERINSRKSKQHYWETMHEIKIIGSGPIAEIIVKEGVINFRLFQSLDEIDPENSKLLVVVTDDKEDNIYVVAYARTCCGEFLFSLIMADKTAYVTSESNLEFLSRAEKKYRESASTDEIEVFLNRPTRIEFTVNSTAKILIFGHQTYIYVCDSNCVLLRYFETTERNDLISLTNYDEVITATHLRHPNTVYVYSINGILLRQFNVAKGQVIFDVISHSTLHMIYILTWNSKEKFQLEIYSQLGQHRENLPLTGFNFAALFAMREGPVAVIYDKGFMLV